ncbi:MAG: hypothetical protein QOI13_202 [Paraburkholderia sp.]|jgi:hypothetical protein|nr:hypothetical protein [Paraburkholderia sp.]
MKACVAAILATLLCGACAQQGGPSALSPQGGSVTMYGTIDTGVAFVK